MTPEEGGWTVLGEQYDINPRKLVPEALWAVAQTWLLCRAEYGLTRFPDAGGVNDQAAWLLDAFMTLEAARNALEDETRER